MPPVSRSQFIQETNQAYNILPTGQQHVHFTQHQMNSQFYYMQSEYAFPSHCNINRAQKPLLIAYLYVTIT